MASGAQLGKEAGDVASVILEFVEALAKEVLLGEDDRKIDGEQHDDHHGGNPQAARGDGESECDDERSEIKRVARVCVRTAGGELLVLVDVSRRERANEDARSGDRQAHSDRGPRRMRDVEVKDGKQESERDANRRAMRAQPVGGAGTGLVAESVMRLQKLACCEDDLGRLNGKKSFVRFGTAAVTGHAVGRTKDHAGGSKWSITRGIRRPEDPDDGNA